MGALINVFIDLQGTVGAKKSKRGVSVFSQGQCRPATCIMSIVCLCFVRIAKQITRQSMTVMCLLTEVKVSISTHAAIF